MIVFLRRSRFSPVTDIWLPLQSLGREQGYPRAESASVGERIEELFVYVSVKGQ